LRLKHRLHWEFAATRSTTRSTVSRRPPLAAALPCGLSGAAPWCERRNWPDVAGLWAIRRTSLVSRTVSRGRGDLGGQDRSRLALSAPSPPSRAVS